MPVKTLSLAITLDSGNVKAGLGQAATELSALDKKIGSIGGSAGKGFGEATQHVSHFRAGLGQAAQDVGKLGDKISIGVTLPVVALGVAATSTAKSFDETFIRMVNLAGVAENQIGDLKDTVLKLASESGQSPQAVAEGLYFIESAGLQGKTAVDALTVSVKASAIGMGSVATVADALTSVIGAYGAANITSARAADVLAVAVKDGKAEASAFAPELGRLLPTAVQLKIPFEQVAGALAYLTRSSGDTALSATQLAGVFNALMAPSSSAVDTLGKLGLSVDDLHASLAEKGLGPTLQMLTDKLGGNSQAIHELFPDIRGLDGVLGLTGEHAAGLAQVMGDTAGATGVVQTAFERFQQSDAGKMDRSWADMQVALVKLGEQLEPTAATIAGFASAVAAAFSALPAPVQTSLIAFTALVALSGPVMSAAGRIESGILAVTRALQSVSALSATGGMGQLATFAGSAGFALAGLVAPAGLALVGLTGLLAVTGSFADTEDDAQRGVRDLTAALREQGGEALQHVNEQIAKTLTTSAAFPDVFQRAGANLAPFIEDIKNGGQQFGQALRTVIELDHNFTIANFRKELAAGKVETNGVTTELLRLVDSGQLTEDGFAQINVVLGDTNKAWGIATGQASQLDYAQQGAAAATGQMGATSQGASTHVAGLGDVTSHTATEVQNLANRVKQLQDDLQASIDPLFGMLHAVESNARAQTDAKQAEDDLAAAIRDHGASSKEAADAQQRLSDANENVASTALDVQSKAVALAGAVQAGTVSVDKARWMLAQWVGQGLLTQAQADEVANKFAFVAAQADGLQGKNVAIPVSAPGIDRILELLRTVTDLQALANQGVQVNVSPGGPVVRQAAGGTFGPHAFVHAGTLIQAFEPETGGEAYVPRFGDRQRNLATLNVAAGWNNAKVVPFADGGIASSGITAAQAHSAALATAHDTLAGSPVGAVVGAEASMANSDAAQAAAETERQLKQLAAAYVNVAEVAGQSAADQLAASNLTADEFTDAASRIVQGAHDQAAAEKQAAADAKAAAEQAKRDAEAIAQAHMAINDQKFQLGLVTQAQRLDVLSHRLGKVSQDSVEYYQILGQIQQVQADVASQHMAEHDVEYRLGKLSTDHYLAMLRKRLAADKEFSPEYERDWNEIVKVQQDAAKKIADAQQDSTDRQDRLYAHGLMSDENYLKVLQHRLAAAEKFSDEWFRISDDIAATQKKIVDDTTTSAQEFADAIDKMTKPLSTAFNANLGFLDSLQRMVDQVDQGKNSLDELSAAGRQDLQAISGAVSAAEQNAMASYTKTGDLAGSTQLLQQNLDSIRSSLTAQGVSGADVDKLFGQLGVTDSNVAGLLQLPHGDSGAGTVVQGNQNNINTVVNVDLSGATVDRGVYEQLRKEFPGILERSVRNAARATV